MPEPFQLPQSTLDAINRSCAKPSTDSPVANTHWWRETDAKKQMEAKIVREWADDLEQRVVTRISTFKHVTRDASWIAGYEAASADILQEIRCVASARDSE